MSQAKGRLLTTKRAVTQAEGLGQVPGPVLWVVCPQFGNVSEVWLKRQVGAFSKLHTQVVCWGFGEDKTLPGNVSSAHALMGAFEAPQQGQRRWLTRLLNLCGRNYFGAVGCEYRALKELAQAESVGVMLCHYGYTALRMLPVSTAVGIPLVAHFHGLDISGALGNRWYRRSLIRSLPRLAAAIVVATYQRKWLVDHGVDPRRVHLIPCGVPVQEFAVSDHVGSEPCRFVAVGRFVEKKSPLDVVRAFEVCNRQVPSTRMMMIGDGPLKVTAQKLALECGLDGKLDFCGSKSSQEVVRALRSSSVFVQHSVTARNGDMEGWPVAVAEAAACGLPVVTTGHSAIPEQVVNGQTGFVVEEHDWRGMGEAMIRLAEDPVLRVRMGGAARERAVMFFDTNDKIAALERVLSDVAQVAGEVVL